MKKLRALGQIHAQAAIHDPELLSQFQTSAQVIATAMQTQASRYDVYYVNLHCANHADLGGNLNMTSLPSKRVRKRSNKNSERQK